MSSKAQGTRDIQASQLSGTPHHRGHQVAVAHHPVAVRCLPQYLQLQKRQTAPERADRVQSLDPI